MSDWLSSILDDNFWTLNVFTSPHTHTIRFPEVLTVEKCFDEGTWYFVKLTFNWIHAAAKMTEY